jgi:import inner membrane translocase subunit TIM10
MSNFGSFGQSGQQQQGGAAAPVSDGVTTARFELEGVADMFNRMSDICFTKCVSKYNSPDLQVAEMTCVDRCVVKYMDVQARIGKRLSENMMAAQQQQ